MDKTDRNELYGTTEDRINTLGAVSKEDTKSVWRVFNAIRTMDFSNEPDEPQAIINHMSDTYGIQLHWVDTADTCGWAMRFDIVDEKLYTLFLLKYN